MGTFDPLPNQKNEKLVALNFGRLKYWIGERNAHISVPVLELLGERRNCDNYFLENTLGKKLREKFLN